MCCACQGINNSQSNIYEQYGFDRYSIFNRALSDIAGYRSVGGASRTGNPSESSSLNPGNQSGGISSGQDTVEISSSAYQQSGLDAASVWSDLPPDVQAQILELKATDQKVRAHEMAHIAAGAGVVTGGATFSYTRGPDGNLYAVGGEVQIDSSEVPGDPEATIRKAEAIQRAALAPADPSAQDRAVAARAAMIASQARMELQKQEMSQPDDPASNTNYQANQLQNNMLYNPFKPGAQSSQESGRNFDLIA
jgi:hypothetical protein